MTKDKNKIAATGEPIRVSLMSVDQRKLFGPSNVFAKEIELRFPVKLVARGNELRIYGDNAPSEQVRDIVEQMISHLNGGGILTEQSLEYAIRVVKKDEPVKDNLNDDRILLTNRHQAIRPRSDGQRRYLEAIAQSDLVFSIGPAGTGKTYLAVASAVRALKERLVDRIILVRPAVEADESLGFLPGDLKDKVDPYLRPLYDALYEMIPAQRTDRYLSDGTIEVAPLAYMRGRTLNNSFIILDEAQNTTIRQMKMFLTRLGIRSKAVVTGDITQVDLSNDKLSGLIQVQRVLEGIEAISFIYLDDRDVVRHKLVQDIIVAYDKFENKDEEEE